jgi:isovaleryl-CoA dehydrogenase
MFTASMRFDLGEDVHALQTLVHRFAQDQIKPLAGDVDRDNQFPAQLWSNWAILGFSG